MNRYLKISAALAAFALLLVVMGLSTQNSVNAQGSVNITSSANFVCSLEDCEQNMATINTDPTPGGSITVTNLDVAETADNPKTFTGPAPLTFVQKFGGSPANEIRAFHGNRIELMHTPTSGFATFKTITVDNVDPTLILNSPASPLIVKGGTNITFSADITDSGSGYTGNCRDFYGHWLTSTTWSARRAQFRQAARTPRSAASRWWWPGKLWPWSKSNFSKIDGGWNVWSTINSTAILAIGSNIPWYFETRDRAGNTLRTAGSVNLKTTRADGESTIDVASNMVTDGRFEGALQAVLL